MDPEKQLEFACKTLDRVLGFFQRVDSRAQVLMGIDVAMLFTLAVNAPSLVTPLWVHAVFVVAAALLGLSLYKVYRVFNPQLRGPELSLIYFQEIAKLAEKEYLDRFTVQTVDGFTRDVLFQAWRNSEILIEKFKSLKDGMTAAGWSLPFWIAALAIMAITKGQIVFK